jgi:hypothetical protein
MYRKGWIPGTADPGNWKQQSASNPVVVRVELLHITSPSFDNSTIRDWIDPDFSHRCDKVVDNTEYFS